MEPTAEPELITLSRQKWRWMSERKTEPLATLFHDKAVFVHMGATMTKDEEIEVIRSGQIHYKNIDIQETSVLAHWNNDCHSPEQDSSASRPGRQ